ncbi:DUF1638 domain-containing protein [Paludibaculum fermentans]|uniref:DUF1638 domain-containing protein n=1 Tax=Paludibaculum fermentans TaxID=1473598 RepID=UPI003EC09B7B
MRLKLISCEVLFREMCSELARSPHQVDVEFMPKGLHDLGGKAMAQDLQKRIDAVPAGQFDAILLGYGLCGNGLHGLEARDTMLVLPRAHDCIALLMGSREQYQRYFDEHPGTYYRSTGWLERGKGLQQLTHNTVGMDVSEADLIAKYGEDNGRYLYEQLTRYRSNYQRLTFIETGLEADTRFEEEARWEAAERGWTFEKLVGNLILVRRLIQGDWKGSDFLITQPGQRIAASYDPSIVRAEDIRRTATA